MSADRLALAGRIQAELADLEQVVKRAERLFEKARRSGDQDWLDGVALNLHGFYAGVERVFEEIARELDGSMPSGPDWHRHVLIQMAAEIPSLRPPVLRRTTPDFQDEYRSFRHVVRNVYTHNLRPSRVQEMVEGLPACYAALAQDLAAFSAFLESPEFD